MTRPVIFMNFKITVKAIMQFFVWGHLLPKVKTHTCYVSHKLWLPLPFTLLKLERQVHTKILHYMSLSSKSLIDNDNPK